MKFFKLLGGVIAAAVLAAAPAAVAKGPNALEAYVAKHEASFGWKVVGPISGPGYHGAVARPAGAQRNHAILAHAQPARIA